MTAREFAAAIDRPYPTVALWLRQKRVPGAYQESVGDFSVWQIPVEAVEEFKPPALGRPPKATPTDGEATTATDAADDGTPAAATSKKAAKKTGKKALKK